MAEVSKVGTPSLSSLTPGQDKTLAGNLYAGEALGAGDACRINAADGRVYRASGAAAGANAKVRGYAPQQYNVGEPVTLVFDVNFRYASGLTPGADLFLSGTVAGGLADAASIGGTAPIGFVVDATRVHLMKSRY